MLRPYSARPRPCTRFAAVTRPSLLLSAGEASGDMYAARLATALKQRAEIEIFGMGGPQMRAAGVEVSQLLVWLGSLTIVWGTFGA